MDTVPLHAFEGNPPFIIIPLTKGKFTIVDPKDADLADVKWYASSGDYAMRRGQRNGSERKAIIMHRVIIERKVGYPLTANTVVDHINGNRFDNRRVNLREATISQNAANAKRGTDRGVKFKHGKWEAIIGYQRQLIYLGAFNTKKLAVEAYDIAATELFGEFARLDREYKEDPVWIIAREIFEQQVKNIPVKNDPLYTIDKNNPSIAYIPINLDKTVIVDSQDVDLAQQKWFLQSGRYAARRIYGGDSPNGRNARMHRIIMERKLGRPIQDGLHIDHVNGNGLDNRRNNLREATQSQNMQNLRLRKDNTSQYKGVRWVSDQTWEARLNDQTIGYFDTAEDASFAYDKSALKRHGEFASLNHPVEQVLAWVPPIRQFGRKNANGYRGIQACGDRWVASIQTGELKLYLGSFDTAEEAAYAYDKKALSIHGKDATLNHSIVEVEAWIPPVRILRMTNTSGYRGVRQVSKNHWYAQIHINKEQNIYLGTFNSPEDASRVYDKAALERWGEQAMLNHPLAEVLSWKDMPQPLSTNTSGYRGVSQIKRNGKWQASYRYEGKLLYLGTFDTSEEAARSYDRTVLKLRGDQAILNFPREDYSSE